MIEDVSLIHCKLDIVFKFLLLRNPLLVKLIIQGVTNSTPLSLTFLNPEILPPFQDGKFIIYDSFLQDELGNYYDIEMQYSPIYKKLLARFHFYSANMIIQQIPKGGDYSTLKPTYQIIFIEDMEDGQGLIKEVKPKDKNGNEEIFTHQSTYYVYMPYINVIAEEKGIKNLSLFEKIVYAIENNFGNGILELGEEVLNCMNNDFEEFLTDEQKAAYRRAYIGGLMTLDAYKSAAEEAISERDEAFNQRNEAFNQRNEAVNQRNEAVNQRNEAVNQRNEAVNQRDEAINKEKQTYLRSIDIFVKELNISKEEAMAKLQITHEMLV